MPLSDLNLHYSSGSGGFLLLHLLLLSRCYHVEFHNDRTFAEAFEQQWKIDDHTKWKDNEIWPNNIKTYQQPTHLNKIYYYANPHSMEYEYYSDFNLAIYTDYDSQQKLTHYKKAGWHYNTTTAKAVSNKFSANIEILREWQKHYNNIKDPTWPKCLSFRKISTLPDYIHEELLSNPYTDRFLNYQYVENSAIYQNIPVHAPMLPFLQSANTTILLQDLVNSRADIMVKLGFINSVNQAQIKFIDHWKSLHSKELLESIGIAID